MKIKPIKQRDQDACGPTCIEMAFRYFGNKVTVKDIAATSQYKQREGMTHSDIIETLEYYGLNVEGKINCSWEDLKNYNTKDNVLIPAWMYKGYIGHVSVVEKVDDTHIYLAEPLTGKIMKMQKIIFMRLWMAYDDMWYPEKNSDIQLRWMFIVSKK